MKIKICLLFFFAFSFFLIGCGNMPPTSYSFADNNSQTATLEFEFVNNKGGDFYTSMRGVFLVDIDGQMPDTENDMYLQYVSSIIVPAGRAMDLRVYIYWDDGVDTMKEGNRRRGIFKCPPLAVDGVYRLSFNVKTKGYFVRKMIDDGTSTIVLERKKVTANAGGSIFGGKTTRESAYDVVCTQAIPPLKN